MAHELYTRTNQKIYFAGLALQSLGRAESGQAINTSALAQADRESALFHLYGALLGLCHEIAGYYRLPQAAAPRAEALLSAQAQHGLAIPELAELVELAQSRETWLARLLSEYAALFLPPQAPKVDKGDVRVAVIQVVSLDEQVAEPELTREELESWRQNLKGLAIRFREGLSEC
ncbi:DUF6586 family protein [Pseudomonas sp. HR96]|uniref:DUF6586 family protein n=1 Tax=Pseudomonas sp. HR96 TaxID=1027966 RepID=UPI002A7608E4|nr:DUF6586 family protein [Pseudomonas sp. HR96]WPO98490.1 DUF6586 family protein [Pseudomonas sp. HR96]